VKEKDARFNRVYMPIAVMGWGMKDVILEAI
jgi:hypothetical protein